MTTDQIITRTIESLRFDLSQTSNNLQYENICGQIEGLENLQNELKDNVKINKSYFFVQGLDD